jgi:hypothetical protein
VKEHAYGQPVERKKVIAVGTLFAISAAITLLGLVFSIYSAVNQVEFQVLNSKFPGAVFGLVIAFLGVRYFLAVRRLKAEVYKPTSRFSLSNFKK